MPVNPLYFLEGYPENQLRTAFLEGLRQRGPGGSALSEEDFVRYLVRGVGKPGIIESEAIQSYSRWRNHNDDDKDPIVRRIIAVMWSLVVEGVLYPRWRILNIGTERVGVQLFITERGATLLNEGGGHPLHGDFIKNLRSRAPACISLGVISRLEDAITCLSRGLCRPSMVMIGLAAEETLRVAHEAFFYLGIIKNSATQFTKMVTLIRQLRSALPTLDVSSEDRQVIDSALAFIDVVRSGRNDASHPGKFDLTAFEVEERIRSSGYYLPIIWQLVIAHAVSAEFKIPDYM